MGLQGLEQECVGFAGTFFEIEVQGFLPLRTKALWSLHIRRKFHILLVFFWQSWQLLLAPSFVLMLKHNVLFEKYGGSAVSAVSCQWFPRSTRTLTAVEPFQMS